MKKSGWRVKKRREIPDKPIVVTLAEMVEILREHGLL
jgi:hypothetical protein